MNYKGTIIDESLEDKAVLKKVKVLSTKVETVVERHKTPWLRKWTLHKVEIPDGDADKIANELSRSLDREHGGSWYADYKNNMWAYIIFRNKIFKIARDDAEHYAEAKKYGISLGIPEYQVDFSPDIE